MPTLGVGTAFDTCFEGHPLRRNRFDRSLQPSLIVEKNEVCSGGVPANWTHDVRLVDTSPLYGTERSVGASLRHALDNDHMTRRKLFVITKPPTPDLYPLMGVRDINEAIDKQLKDLQIWKVDILLAHRSGERGPGNGRSNATKEFDRALWGEMENAAFRGAAHALGVTGVKAAAEAIVCATSEDCSEAPRLVEDVWSPCHAEGLAEVSEDLASKISLLGTSAVKSCLGEPHTALLAKQHKVQSGAVSIRWALQTGVPVLMRSHQPGHLHENAKAFEIELSSQDMAHLGLLSLLYRLGPSNSRFHWAMLNALGESHHWN